MADTPRYVGEIVLTTMIDGTYSWFDRRYGMRARLYYFNKEMTIDQIHEFISEKIKEGQ